MYWTKVTSASEGLRTLDYEEAMEVIVKTKPRQVSAQLFKDYYTGGAMFFRHVLTPALLVRWKKIVDISLGYFRKGILCECTLKNAVHFSHWTNITVDHIQKRPNTEATT